MKKTITTTNVEQTTAAGESIGHHVQGGEFFECISDLGGGKTSFVRGLVRGFGSKDPVASPTFTISTVYSRPDKKTFHHFDFYRLSDPGIMSSELTEVLHDKDTVVAIEWADIVHELLPKVRVSVTLKSDPEDENKRIIEIIYPEQLSYLMNDI